MRLKMYVIKQRLTKMLNDKKQKQKWGQKLDGLQISEKQEVVGP